MCAEATNNIKRRAAVFPSPYPFNFGSSASRAISPQIKRQHGHENRHRNSATCGDITISARASLSIAPLRGGRLRGGRETTDWPPK
jgi:hypothetical protein